MTKSIFSCSCKSVANDFDGSRFLAYGVKVNAVTEEKVKNESWALNRWTPRGQNKLTRCSGTRIWPAHFAAEGSSDRANGRTLSTARTRRGVVTEMAGLISESSPTALPGD